MRVIESKMLNAIKSRKSMRCDNTEVVTFGDVSEVYLHGNKVAEISPNYVYVQDCGWQTVTTKSRINAILRSYNLGNVSAKKFQWFVNGAKWHGSFLGELNNA
jgi:hypothetical protein